MVDQLDQQKRIESALRLLTQDLPLRQKLESLSGVVKNVNPRLDGMLNAATRALSDLEKIQDGQMAELAAENLPEETEEQKKKKKKALLWLKLYRQLERGELPDSSLELLPEETEEEKKRKKAFLWLWRSFKDLQGEINRIKTEWEKIEPDGQPDAQKEINFGGRVVALAKGKFGLLTLAAVLIVGGGALWAGNRSQTPTGSTAREGNTKNGVQNSGSQEQQFSYYVKETQASLDVSKNQITWGVHVHRENFETQRQKLDIPATGAEVTVGLSGGSNEVLQGTVGDDGWVRWVRSIPGSATVMKIKEVKGDLAWNSTDQRIWQGQDAASYKPGL